MSAYNPLLTRNALTKNQDDPIRLPETNDHVPELAIKTSSSISTYGPVQAPNRQPNVEGNAPLINPLAFHTYDFVPGLKGHLCGSMFSIMQLSS